MQNRGPTFYSYYDATFTNLRLLTPRNILIHSKKKYVTHEKII
jgi:hypothetical protein